MSTAGIVNRQTFVTRQRIFGLSQTMGVREIAAELGLTPSRVKWQLWKFRKEHELPMTPVGEVMLRCSEASRKASKRRDQWIGELAGNGLTVPEIAARQGITVTRVLAALARVGASKELPDDEDADGDEAPFPARLEATGDGCKVCGLRGEHVCLKGRTYEERRRPVSW